MKPRRIFVRALPKTCTITETYGYEQEVSRNPSVGRAGRPQGRIKLLIPYDGWTCFTRKAIEDVEKQLRQVGNESVRAALGHLMLDRTDGFEMSWLDEIAPDHGTLPLEAPVQGDGLKGTKSLMDNGYAAEIVQDYTPAFPDINPIRFEVEVFDENQLSEMQEESFTSNEVERIAGKLREGDQFPQGLYLQIRGVLDLSRSLVGEDLTPIARRVSISWPTVTSLRALSLTVGDSPRPVRYNPVSKSLEWTEVAFHRSDALSPASDLVRFESDVMLLLIGQPGELYQYESLDGQVELELPNCLVSGCVARLFDGTGALVESPRIRRRSILKCRLQLILDDAFAQRAFSPYQQLQFDEVVPEDMRFADVKATLTDRGFSVTSSEIISSDMHRFQFVQAQRAEGVYSLKIWLLVRGEQFSTQRHADVPGGQRYVSTFNSGRMTIDVRGQVVGEMQTMMREFNALRKELNRRFESTRARR